MANKKVENNSLDHKLRVLAELFDFGCRTEKDLQALTVERILQMEGITIADLSVILELQKQVKKNTLYSYLGGGADEPLTDS